MYGADIEQLNVLLQTMPVALNNVTSTLLWTKSGSQGNQWHRAKIVHEFLLWSG